jgi:HEAT repeat protein
VILFYLIAKALVILFGIVITLSIWVVLFNPRAMRREASAKKGRMVLRESLLCYLRGEIHVSAFSTAARDKEELLIGLVAQIAEELGEPARQKLIYIFETSGTHHIVVNELKKLSQSRSWHKRQRTATYLPYIAINQVIIPPLLRALEDKELMVRFSAAHSLSKIKATEAIVPILEKLALPARWPIERTIEILNEMGSEAVDTLLEYLSFPGAKPDGKIHAISALGLQHTYKAIPSILTHLNHSNKEIRIHSARALGNIGSPDAASALCEAMHDSEWEVRAACARSLGLLKVKSALPFLHEGMGDPAWWVRYNSADSLAELGDEGVKALKEAFSHNDKFARDISRQVLQERNILKRDQGVAQ